MLTKYLLATMAITALGSSQNRPQFEVATIKPNHSGMMGARLMMQPGGRFKGDNLTLKFLIEFAYNIKTPQISGGPDWVNSEHYDVEAKPEDGALANLSPDDQNQQMRLMLQSLLADRFKLTLRHESKDLPMYVLVVAKNGPKIKLSKDQGPSAPPPPPPSGTGARIAGGGPMPRGMMRLGRGDLDFNGVELKMFADGLSRLLGRPVVDKTGLTGKYEIKLKWTPDASEGRMMPGGGPGPGPEAPPPSDPSGPNLFTAIQEQLGLKLESQKGPVETLVIERVEKPTEN